ncbi:MAG: iron ABC transporter permease [Syntrophobacter sp.]
MNFTELRSEEAVHRSRALLIFLLPLPVAFLSLMVGPVDTLGPGKLLEWLVNSHADSTGEEEFIRTILLDVRLPRIILSFLVGGALAISGNALQALFRNPLVSPYLLGLSSGAAFGAALALATSWLPLQVSAFTSGMASVGISYFLARTRKSVSIISLILSGIIVTGIFSSLLTIVQFLSDPFRLQTIVHWTMGNLHNASWAKLKSAAPLIGLGTVWLFMLRWRMNVIALGEVETRAVGLNPGRERMLILVPATLVASASVAVSGVIGLVGLVVPHMVRMLLGPDNRIGVPACFAFGGTFLLIVDDMSRALASFEIPIGIFTTLIGGPFFIYLLKKSRFGWDE